MGVSADVNDVMHDTRQYGRVYVPLVFNKCKNRGCSRPVYAAELCKQHADLLHHKRTAKAAKEPRKR